VFRYRVGAADFAPRGISVSRLVGLPSGTSIRDAAGNAAVVGLPALVSAGIRVDGRSRPRSMR
jgi:hypothetical protein